jgi:hypothetical protein
MLRCSVFVGLSCSARFARVKGLESDAKKNFGR